MDKYLLTLLVTFEQEYAIQKLFGRHGWEYSKIDKPKEDFINTNTKNETTRETETDLTGNAVRKKPVTGETIQNIAAETDTAHKVLSNPEKNSDVKGLSTLKKDTRKNPVVVMDRVFDGVKKMDASGNVVGSGNVIKSESDEEDNVEDYGGDTDTEEGNLDELGITVKIETHSDVDDHLVEEAASSLPVKRTGRGRIVQAALKRPAATKTSIVKRSKRRKTAAEDTNVTNEVNVDIKVEDVETDDPLQFLETLPDVKLFSEGLNSEMDDIETFLSGPDDVDESGFSARLSAYFCKDCHYTFPEETYYSVHKREGKCVFPCPYCNEKFTFRNYSKFREHQKKHTKRMDIKVEQEKISMAALGIMFLDQSDDSSTDQITSDTKIDLSTHSVIDVFVDENGELLQCKECGKLFKTKGGLTTHEANHKGEYRYQCCICGKGFQFLHDFNGHQTQHTGIKKYKCDRCGNKYTYKNYFKVHAKACGGSKSNLFTCDICNKTFKQKRYLKEHKEGHENPERFQCAACGEYFKHRASFYKHSKSTGHQIK